MADNYLEEASELVRQLRVRENFGDKLAGAAATTIMELIVAISEIKKNEARKAEEKKVAEERAKEIAKTTPKVKGKVKGGKEENSDASRDAVIDSLLDGLDTLDSEIKIDSFISANKWLKADSKWLKTEYFKDFSDKIISEKNYDLSSWSDYKFGEADL